LAPLTTAAAHLLATLQSYLC